MNEKIVLIRPFAYVRMFDTTDDSSVTIETKSKVVEAKKLIGRLYWVGFL